MNVDKIRNLTDVELAHQQTELADQLFKLKFQMKMGQTESLKKIRDLKKDIARMQTIEREKRAAGGNGAVVSGEENRGPGGEGSRDTESAEGSQGEEGGQQSGCDGEEVSHERNIYRNNEQRDCREARDGARS